MTVSEAFGIAGAIIASLGGGTAIVFSLSSWLGKVWANRILENEKAAHNKEIEQYKSRLQEEIARTSAIRDKALYISKAQYDNEYRIYQEIWEKLYICVVTSIRLYPGYEEFPLDLTERQKYQENKYHEFASSYNDYAASITKYAPFYVGDFCDDFIKVREKCNDMGTIFKHEVIDKTYNASFTAVKDEPMSSEDRKMTITLRKEIMSAEEELAKKIRVYLQSLRLQE